MKTSTKSNKSYFKNRQIYEYFLHLIIEKYVFQLQHRIYKAEKKKKLDSILDLKKMFTKSWSAQVLSRWISYKLNSKKRNLYWKNVLKYRKKQYQISDPLLPEHFLTILVLEPQWEARFEEYSFCYRPGLTTYHALSVICENLEKQTLYVLKFELNVKKKTKMIIPLADNSCYSKTTFIVKNKINKNFVYFSLKPKQILDIKLENKNLLSYFRTQSIDSNIILFYYLNNISSYFFVYFNFFFNDKSLKNSNTLLSKKKIKIYNSKNPKYSLTIEKLKYTKNKEIRTINFYLNSKDFETSGDYNLTINHFKINSLKTFLKNCIPFLNFFSLILKNSYWQIYSQIYFEKNFIKMKKLIYYNNAYLSLNFNQIYLINNLNSFSNKINCGSVIEIPNFSLHICVNNVEPKLVFHEFLTYWFNNFKKCFFLEKDSFFLNWLKNVQHNNSRFSLSELPLELKFIKNWNAIFYNKIIEQKFSFFYVSEIKQELKILREKKRIHLFYWFVFRNLKVYYADFKKFLSDNVFSFPKFFFTTKLKKKLSPILNRKKPTLKKNRNLNTKFLNILLFYSLATKLELLIGQRYNFKKMLRLSGYKLSILKYLKKKLNSFYLNHFKFRQLCGFFENILFHGIETHFSSWGGREQGNVLKRGYFLRYGNLIIVMDKNLDFLKKSEQFFKTWSSSKNIKFNMENIQITNSFFKFKVVNSKSSVLDKKIYNNLIKQGFNFLGFYIYQSKLDRKIWKRINSPKLFVKTKIYPAKLSIKVHLQQLKLIIRKNQTKSQKFLIKKLSPYIRMWSNYYNIVSNKKMHAYCDFITFKMLWDWACKRHSKKSKKWIKAKYFHCLNGKNWVFGSYQKAKNSYYCLPNHTDFILLKIHFFKKLLSPFNFQIPLGYYKKISNDS